MTSKLHPRSEPSQQHFIILPFFMAVSPQQPSSMPIKNRWHFSLAARLIPSSGVSNASYNLKLRRCPAQLGICWSLNFWEWSNSLLLSRCGKISLLWIQLLRRSFQCRSKRGNFALLLKHHFSVGTKKQWTTRKPTAQVTPDTLTLGRQHGVKWHSPFPPSFYWLLSAGIFLHR